MSGLQTRIPPPLLWVIAAAITWIVARVDVDGSPLSGIASEWLGVAMAALGIAIAFAGIREFGRANTTSDPIHVDEASTVVSTGVYRFTRNPMYLGLVLISIGWALRLGTAAGMVVGTGFLIVVLTVLQIRPEEEAMTARFGQGYLDYRASVRRWI